MSDKAAKPKKKQPLQEENVVEETIREPGGQPAPQQIDLDALRTEVEGILKQRDEAMTMLKQVSADFENYKKRNAQARTEAAADAAKDIVSAMLPVLDNLERAIDAAQAGESGALIAGVDMVAKQFVGVLEGLGVAAIESACGEPFDPDRHNAVMTVPADEEHKDNTVFDTLQKGYAIGDKVIRYAMVRVAKDE